MASSRKVSIQEKKRYFQRPESKKEIIYGRKPLEVGANEFSDALDQLGEDEALVLKEPLYDREKYPKKERFLKRGPELRMNKSNITRRMAIEERMRPRELRDVAFRNLSEDDQDFGSFGYVSYRNKHLVSHLDDCYEGSKIFAFWESVNPMNTEEKTREYWSEREIGKKGGVFTVDVPSRSGNFSYPVTLMSFPLPLDEGQYATWFNFNSLHNCKDRQNSFSFRYSETETACPHIIAAYIASARDAFHNLNGRQNVIRNNEVPDILIPFPLPSENAVRYGENMDRVWVDIKDERGRPMNKADREVAWFQGVKRHGPEFFYARKKLSEMFNNQEHS